MREAGHSPVPHYWSYGLLEIAFQPHAPYAVDWFQIEHPTGLARPRDEVADRLLLSIDVIDLSAPPNGMLRNLRDALDVVVAAPKDADWCALEIYAGGVCLIYVVADAFVVGEIDTHAWLRHFDETCRNSTASTRSASLRLIANRRRREVRQHVRRPVPCHDKGRGRLAAGPAARDLAPHPAVRRSAARVACQRPPCIAAGYSAATGPDQTPRLLQPGVQRDGVEIEAVGPGRHAKRDEDAREERGILQRLYHRAAFSDIVGEVFSTAAAVGELDGEKMSVERLGGRDFQELDHSSSAPMMASKGSRSLPLPSLRSIRGCGAGPSP